MSQVLHWIVTGVVFITMISLLVAAHELGHYLFARWFKMGVEEFAIGFGSKRLVVWHRRTYDLKVAPGETADAATLSRSTALEGGTQHVDRELIQTPDGVVIRETTDFTIRPWPIGGFVRIKGMVPEEDGSETRIPGGFYSKPPWQRLLVLFAGPLFSVVAGVLVLIPVYTTWGIEQQLNEPVIGGVAERGEAASAGLKPEDRILTIQGRPVETFYQLVQQIQGNPNRALAVTYRRGNETRATTLTPGLRTGPVFTRDLDITGEFRKQGMVGIGPKTVKKPLPLGEAVSEATMFPVKAVAGLARIFQKPETFEHNVGGPATMVALTSRMSERGLEYVLFLSALLSISVGIFNLLPVPPLDGGQMLIAFAEMLRRGRRLSLKVQGAITGVGFALVMTLVAAVLIVDVRRFTGLSDPMRERAKPPAAAPETPTKAPDPAEKTESK